MSRILVINPNSNEQVTDNLRESVASIESAVSIDCCTLNNGPFGIESDADVEVAATLVVDRIREETEYDAFVIACYSDPGLDRCRAATSAPVFAMQESAVRAAAADDRHFGVLALSETSIARHIPYIASLGVASQLVAELPLDISVEESANDPDTLEKVVVSGKRLIDEFGAEAIVLGCAGMAAIQQAAQKKLPVPVIEPAQAAVGFAIEAIR